MNGRYAGELSAGGRAVTARAVSLTAAGGGGREGELVQAQERCDQREQGGFDAKPNRSSRTSGAMMLV